MFLLPSESMQNMKQWYGISALDRHSSGAIEKPRPVWIPWSVSLVRNRLARPNLNRHLLSKPSHPKRPQSLCAFNRAQILLTSSCSSFTELTIVSCYPGTGAPTETISDDWNRIPGARGYTPQACSSRDEMAKLHRLAVQHGLGLSEEHTPYQKDANTGCAFRRSNYSQMKTSSSLQH
ncbi:hypothetical protein IAQ61_001210 [Plenodomus lingam]|uniref:uncharacterized protein n=1 Tax=Leptosphaeria maculans TaxID=5022 RepID=UPI00333382F2|nr:hypothetical protein IAQ61_001210 [Plenodomus lingam]